MEGENHLRGEGGREGKRKGEGERGRGWLERGKRESKREGGGETERGRRKDATYIYTYKGDRYYLQ